MDSFPLGKIKFEISKWKLKSSKAFFILKYTTNLKCPAMRESSPPTG
jgi:hypothetical protein